MRSAREDATAGKRKRKIDPNFKVTHCHGAQQNLLKSIACSAIKTEQPGIPLAWHAGHPACDNSQPDNDHCHNFSAAQRLLRNNDPVPSPAVALAAQEGRNVQIIAVEGANVVLAGLGLRLRLACRRGFWLFSSLACPGSLAADGQDAREPRPEDRESA